MICGYCVESEITTDFLPYFIFPDFEVNVLIYIPHSFQILIFVFPKRGANFIQMLKIKAYSKKSSFELTDLRFLAKTEKNCTVLQNRLEKIGIELTTSRGHQPNAPATVPPRSERKIRKRYQGFRSRAKYLAAKKFHNFTE